MFPSISVMGLTSDIAEDRHRQWLQDKFPSISVMGLTSDNSSEIDENSAAKEVLLAGFRPSL